MAREDSLVDLRHGAPEPVHAPRVRHDLAVRTAEEEALGERHA